MQEGVSWELILVDDASNQPPEEFYAQLGQGGHKVLRNEERRGPGAARNQGARIASGKWLAFLDSDDHWLPRKLALQMESLEPSGCRIGQVDEIWYRHGRRVNPLEQHRIEGGDLYERSLVSVCVSPSSVVLERSLFLDLGGFDEEFFVCEDYDLWLKIAVLESFHHLPEPLVVKYGGHPDQLSKALPAMDRFRVLSLIKGFASGLFDERPEPAYLELQRKLEILRAGASKRDRAEVNEILEQLTRLVTEDLWEAALECARELVEQWPTRPD